MEVRPEKLVVQEVEPQHAEVDINFQGVNIKIKSEYSLTAERFREMEEEVTGMEVMASSASGTDAALMYLPSEEIGVEYHDDDKELFIQGPSRLFGDGRALMYTAHYMAECLRASKNGLLLVHAAAVQLPDQESSYIFLGEKGAGKTTMALRLCHQYGYKLIGNDQILMGPDDNDELVVNGGNAWFDVRQTAVSADQYIANLVPSTASENTPSWNNKTRVNPEDIGVEVAEGEAPIKSIFHIRIDHTQQELFVDQWKGVQKALILHERFGRHISGQATPLQDDKGNYLGSLPPICLERSMRARDKLVRMVLNAGITEIFAPNSDSAVEYIVDNTN